jgi:quercetin dioxygenase-like cupin family protein
MGTSIRNGFIGFGVGVALCLLGMQLWAANGNPFLRTTARIVDVPVHVIGADEARVQVLLHRGLGLSSSAMSRIVGKPGWEILPHRHERSDELLFVLEGGGTLTLEGREIRVSEQTAVWIPRGQEHSWRTGTAGVRALQIYAPGGPEQRFLKAPLLNP